MQIKQTLSTGLKRVFNVSVSAKTIEEKLNKRLEEIGKKVKIPGFRPGKIPLTLLKQRYKGEALSEVLEDCVQTGIEHVIKENDLRPALRPTVDFKKFEEGKDLGFDITLEVLPTLEEINLDNLSFEKLVVTVPVESVTQVIETIAKTTQSTRPIETPRKTKKGDVLLVDIEGSVEGEALPGAKEDRIELGSETSLPDFEKQLIGHEKGALVNVTVTLPNEIKNEHLAPYAGKQAQYKVTIKDIHEYEPFEIDLAFAEKLGFESVEAVKEKIEQNLSKNYEAQSFLNIKRHVLDALAERFSFEIPQTMVELEFKNIWNQLCRELGIDQDTAANANAIGKVGSKTFEEAADKTEEELRKEYHAIAERRVRLGILLAEIGNRNDVTVSRQELTDALMAHAREFPGQEDKVFEYYRNNESALATLRAPLFENKVIDYILTKSKITEKKITPEELEKLLALEEEEAEKKLSAEVKQEKKPAKKKENKGVLNHGNAYE